MEIVWRENSIFATLLDAIKLRFASDLGRLLLNIPGKMVVSCNCKVPGSPHKKGLHVGVYDESLNVLKVTYQLWGNESRYEFHLRPPDGITLWALRVVLMRAIKMEKNLESKNPKAKKPLPEMVRPKPTPVPVVVPDIKTLRVEVLEPKPTVVSDVVEQKTVVVTGQGIYDHTTPVLTYLTAMARGHERPVLTLKATMELITMYFHGDVEAASRFMWFLNATGQLSVGARQVSIPKEIYESFS